MTDRRALWSNGTVAHTSLKGQAAADRFTDGQVHRVLKRFALAALAGELAEYSIEAVMALSPSFSMTNASKALTCVVLGSTTVN
mgnify:CR=1 FL=1